MLDFILLIIFFLVLVYIFTFVFWLMMLVHAISKPIRDKGIWIAALILFGFIGSLVYFFSVRKEYKDVNS